MQRYSYLGSPASTSPFLSPVCSSWKRVSVHVVCRTPGSDRAPRHPAESIAPVKSTVLPRTICQDPSVNPPGERPGDDGILTCGTLSIQGGPQRTRVIGRSVRLRIECLEIDDIKVWSGMIVDGP